MIQQIINAINSRFVIKFIYHDQERIIEPHTYGLSLKNNEMLSGYQTGGHSTSGNLPDWRQFNVEEISNIELTSNTFNPRVNEGYIRGPDNQNFSEIYSEV